MATSGQLLSIIRRDAPPPPRQINARLVDGKLEPWGGGCGCWLCATKKPREGFYKAPKELYEANEAIERQLDAWIINEANKLPPVRPKEKLAEYQQRIGYIAQRREWK